MSETPGASSLHDTGAEPGRSRRRGVCLIAGVGVVLLVVALVVVVSGDEGGDDRGWTVELTGEVETLTGDEDTVCGSVGDAIISCWDAATGDELFLEAVGGRSVLLSLANRTLMVADLDADKVLMYSLDGELLWDIASERVASNGGFYEFSYGADPAVADGVLLTQEDRLSSEVVGVDVTTGRERWRMALTPPGDDPEVDRVSTVVSDGQTFYVSHWVSGPSADEPANQLVALDAETGDELWRWIMEPPGGDGGEEMVALGSVARVAAFDDGTAVAFVVGMPRAWRTVVLDASTGDLLWQTDPAYAATVPAYVGGYLVLFSGTELRGYNSEGDELWTTAAPNSGTELPNPEAVVYGQLYATDDHLYFRFSGEVSSVDLRTGESRVVMDERTSAPVVAAGHMVTATRSGAPGDLPPELQAQPLDG